MESIEDFDMPDTCRMEYWLSCCVWHCSDELCKIYTVGERKSFKMLLKHREKHERKQRAVEVEVEDVSR